MDEEDKNRDEVEWVVNREMKVKAGVLFTFKETFLANANPEMKIFLSIEKTPARQTNNQAQHNQGDGILKNLPLSSSLNPVTLANIDIAVRDDTNREETVEEVDKEVVTDSKRTNVHRTYFIENAADHQNAWNIRQTYYAVNTNQLVYQGGGRDSLDHPEDREVYGQDGRHSEHTKPVQEFIVHKII